MNMIFLAPLSAFLVCWSVLFVLLRWGSLPKAYPNKRSLHVRPTPCIGGLGIMAGMLVGAALLADAELIQMILAASALAVVSVLDDVRGMPVALRFFVHLIVALICMLTLELDGWTLLLATLTVVWMTNLYNFMDGSDGLAGGMAAIGFGALALAAWQADAPELAVFCISIAAAALAFLCFNFPPARIFMGDAGSIPLGFLAASAGILGVKQNVWPFFFPLLVFSPFILDASVTLARRGLRGEKVWQAHRSHYYQRVVLLGASHRQLLLGAYTLMLASTVLAFELMALPQHVAWLLALWATSYLLIFLAIDWHWNRARNES